MSQTQATADSQVNPGQAFRHLIWENPEICSNCFARCKHIDTLETPDWGNDNQPSSTSWRTPQGEIGYDTDVHDDYGAIQTHEPRTTCSRCGSVRLLADDDTLSREQVEHHIREIAARLTEDGHSVNESRMLRFARLVKRVPELQRKDFEIFVGAVYYGLL